MAREGDGCAQDSRARSQGTARADATGIPASGAGRALSFVAGKSPRPIAGGRDHQPALPDVAARDVSLWVSSRLLGGDGSAAAFEPEAEIGERACCQRLLPRQRLV